MAGRTMAKGLTGRSQRLVFLTGVLLAAVAAVLVFLIASSSGGGSGDRVPVVTAAQDIPAQTNVTSDMLQVSFVGADEAQDGVFSSRGQVIDRTTTTDIQAGAQVVTDAVSESVGDGVTYVVEPGYRALGVEVKEVVTAGGNLKPGDHVDVIGIFEVADVESANNLLKILGISSQVTAPPRPRADVNAQGQEDAPSGHLVLTTTMYQNVKMLALAQTLTEVTAGGTVADKSSEAQTEPKATTATLQLTPQQAQETTWADQFGILRLSARPVSEDQPTDVHPTLFWIEREL